MSFCSICTAWDWCVPVRDLIRFLHEAGPVLVQEIDKRPVVFIFRRIVAAGRKQSGRQDKTPKKRPIFSFSSSAPPVHPYGYAATYISGILTVNVVPSPSLLYTLIEPLCAITVLRTIASPSPVPPISLECDFIHPVKPLENMRLVRLRDADPGIFHLDVEIIMVRIQGYMDPSVLVVVLTAFSTRLETARENFISSISAMTGRKLSMTTSTPFLFAMGRSPLQGLFEKVVYVYGCYIHVLSGLVHFDERQKIGDDLVFPIDLPGNVFHEFPVHFRRHIRRLKE